MNQHINTLDIPEVRKLRASNEAQNQVNLLTRHERPRFGWVQGHRRPVPTSGPKPAAPEPRVLVQVNTEDDAL